MEVTDSVRHLWLALKSREWQSARQSRQSPNVTIFPTKFGTAGATIYGRNSTRFLGLEGLLWISKGIGKQW